jgi:acetyltransferase
VFFAPDSVAIVGASTNPGKVGHGIMKNMVSFGYAGEVYPVNPHAAELLGRRCYPSVLDIPGAVTLAVIVVPAPAVIEVLGQCAEKGVRGAVIISAGFKETGGEGAEREREIARIAAAGNIRVIGPNCLGVLRPGTGLNASFAPGMPAAGSLALMSQSGALATAILDWAQEEEIGFSKFVSFGNGVDVGVVDLLRAWEDDPETNCVVAYMEGVTDGPAFMEAARAVTAKKPLLVVKSGGTAAGARAVSSHTGSLAGSEQAYDAAFHQSGVIRARSVEELFDYARAFVYQGPPRGRRVAIVTNAGGPGIMATDACERFRLSLASIKKETVDTLRQKLPAASNFYNPIDLLGDAPPERYDFALRTVLADDGVDGAVVILTPQAVTDIPGVAEVVQRGANNSTKPVLGCFMGGKAMHQGSEILARHKVPNYLYPERAIAAFAAMADYWDWLQHPADEPPAFPVDRERARRALDAARRQGRLTLGELEAREVCAAYGFTIPRSELATSAEEAGRLAADIGFPVVMKIASPDILHKSDIGGVRLGIGSPSEAVDAFDLMTLRAQRYMPDAEIWGVLVQEMIPGGREVIFGLSRDPQFGPLVMFGLGGIYVEILKDVTFRVAPFGPLEAAEAIAQIRGYPLLAGTRGEAPADMDALTQTLLRFSQLAAEQTDIVEMDINPLKVLEPGRGAIAIDARITIAENSS